MKKVIFISAILALIALSCQSTTEPPVDTYVSCYMPLDIGSNWIYETTITDIYDNTFVVEDSMVIVDKITSGGKKYYELHVIRADTLFSRFHMRYGDGGIVLLSRLLHPFLDLDSTTCLSSTDSLPKLIYTNTDSWSHHDSLKGDEYPSLVGEGGEEYNTILSQTANVYDYVASYIEKPNLITDLSSRYKSSGLLGIEFSGWKKFQMIKPENIQFKKNGGCLYEDSARTIKSDFNLKIIYKKNIGIVYFEGYSERCKLVNGDCDPVRQNKSSLKRYDLRM